MNKLTRELEERRNARRFNEDVENYFGYKSMSDVAESIANDLAFEKRLREIAKGKKNEQ